MHRNVAKASENLDNRTVTRINKSIDVLKDNPFYRKGIKNWDQLLLEKRFIPETTNAMEQLFLVIDNFVDQARSFKAKFSTVNFFYNLFASMNR